MIEIKINTVELDINQRRVLIQVLHAVLDEWKLGYTLVSELDNKDVQLPIDPIGDSITLGEMDEQMYAEGDKNVAKALAEYNRTGYVEPEGEPTDDAYGELDEKLHKQSPEITEEEFNNLFQQDHKDQNDNVDKDTNERSEFYKSDRPVDP